MKKLAIFLGLLLAASALSATPVRVVVKDSGTNKIQFAYGSIDNTIYWKQVDYDATLAADAPFSSATATAILYTPTAFEVSLTTCPLSKIATLDDFSGAQTQLGIMPYLDDLWVRIKTLTDSNQNAKQQRTQSCYDFLSSTAKTLP